MFVHESSFMDAHDALSSTRDRGRQRVSGDLR